MNSEMDKTRHVRRGGNSRFSRKKLLVGLEKPKERLIKELSVVNKAAKSSSEDYQMGCNNNYYLPYDENGIETSSQTQSTMSNAAKRNKLPKTFFSDCRDVDHSPVPRKIRSAMKKRNGESISPPLPDSNKLNHAMGGAESLKKDAIKKSKLNVKQGSLDWSQKQVVGLITKDEEEVVETLYALAGMFPDNDSVSKCKLETDTSEAKSPALVEYRENPTPAIKVIKEFSLTSPLRTSIAAPSSDVESLEKETDSFTSLEEPSTEIQEKPPNLQNSKNFPVKTDSYVPPVVVHSTISLLAKKEHTDDQPLCNPEIFQVLPELSLDLGKLKQSTKQDASVTRNSEFAFGATTSKNQDVQQDIVMGSRKNGLALWPGLSPLVLHAWLDAAIGASKPCLLEYGPTTRKVHKEASSSRSRKRCAAHVYISNLIRDLQVPEIQCNQLKPSDEEQRQETHYVTRDLDRVKKGLNGIISANNIGSSNVERNASEARSGFLQHKRLPYDHLQTTTAAGYHTMQNQNFLSLPAGSVGEEATKSFNETRNNPLEPLSQFQDFNLHSYPHHKFMPVRVPPTHYTSSYSDKLSISGTGCAQQVQLQFPPYLSNPLIGTTHTSSTFLSKQHQQQQQQLWAAQQAAQCRPPGHSTAMSQFSNWPNGRQDPPLIPFPQSLVSPSPSTSILEVLGPKYSSTSQQQHQHEQMMAIAASLPSARMKTPDPHLPLVYGEIGCGYRSSGSLSLQLLCNERL